MKEMDIISTHEWDHICEEDRKKIAAAVKADLYRNGSSESMSMKQLYEDLTFSWKGDTFYTKFGKRFLDIAVSAPILVICSPLNLVLAVITYLDVGSPILFSQERIGRNLSHFRLVKFRSMNNERNADGVLLPPEERITKWGAWVRKTSLDELLNFWSIFKGDMSVIGPRPLPVKYQERFSSTHQKRHLVRPGLECPYHNKALAGKGWQGRLDNDVWYVSHISFRTDCKMTWLLIKKVFSREERAESVSGKTGEFMGYYPDGSVMDSNGIPRKYLRYVKKDI